MKQRTIQLKYFCSKFTMRKMSTTGQHVFLQTFAKVVDSFVDRKLDGHWSFAMKSVQLALMKCKNSLGGRA